MTVRTLLITGSLALASASLGLAKTYDITITEPTKAGAVELQPGQYKLKMEGSQAVFTDSRDKSFSVSAKVENAGKKFNYTSLESSDQNGVGTLQAIDLGDSNTRIALGK